MPKWNLRGVVLECVQGDIARQPDVQAVVNAANAELRMGGGVAGAIHRAAGLELDRACRDLAPIRPGEAVITGAYELPNRHVIHCLGPVYGLDREPERLLANCYRSALHLADQHEIISIAFPAISTGAFGCPMAPAAQVAFQTIIGMLAELKSVRHIRFVLFSERDSRIHATVLRALVGPPVTKRSTDDEGLLDEF